MTTSEHEERVHAQAIGLLPNDEKLRVIPDPNPVGRGHDRRLADDDRTETRH